MSGGGRQGLLPSLHPGRVASSPGPGHDPRTRRPDRPPQSQRACRRPTPDFDPAIYKGRNVIERFFNRIKEFRAIATRYDKHARNYRAGIVLAGIITLLRDQLCDTP